jgi:amino acid adenylation domain-containing protein
MHTLSTSKDLFLVTLVDVARRRGSIQADCIAYRFLADGEEEQSALTYGELDLRARATAAELQKIAKTGERALLLDPAGLDFIVAFLGCLYAGVVAVPLYAPRINKRTNARIEAVVNDAQPTVVLSSRALSAAARNLLETVSGSPIAWLDTDGVASDKAEEWSQPALTEDSVAFLQYTSGSTSTPKGVIVTHGNILHNEAMIQAGFGTRPDDVIAGWLPLYHDMGLIGNVLQPLYVGVPCILMSPQAFLQRPARWLETISRYQATVSGGPNFAYDLCAEKIRTEDRKALDLSSWRVAFNGAEPVRPRTLERFAREFQTCGFRKEAFRPCYGLAEATLFVTGTPSQTGPLTETFSAHALARNQVRACQQTAPSSSEMSPLEATNNVSYSRLVACGQAVSGQELAIVEPNSLHRCAIDEVGEIWFKGRSVAKGYWNSAKKSDETFHAHIADEEKTSFLRTGDLGFIHDGQLFITGRRKDLIIIRGQNHYPQDIELTVEKCSSILQTGCGAAFSVDVGGEERLVIVQEIARQDANLELDTTIRAICENVAINHELAAHAILLIRAHTIPKTSSGKIQRHACKAAYLSKALHVVKEWHAGEGEHTPPVVEEPFPYALPEDEKRRAACRWFLAEIASRAAIDPRAVDVRQPIVAYGFDSLATIELTHTLQSKFALGIEIDDLLEGQTLADVLRRIEQETEDALPCLNRGPEERHALSYGQRALWFLQQIAPETAAYHICRAVRILSAVDQLALRNAFQAVVDRHPSLRTVFFSVAGEPAQRVEPSAELCFEYRDASSYSEAQLRSALREDSCKPFDLVHGPLFRLHLYRRGDEDHVLHMAVHHLVADFWSLQLLLEEVGTIYHIGNTKNLPQLPHTYAHFVDWQQRTLASEEGERLWSYWKQELWGEISSLNLPADHTRPAVQRFRGRSIPFFMGKELTGRIRELAAQKRSTLFTVLLSAFQTLLHRLTGQQRIIVGSPVAGRPRNEFASIVGYFVNPVPLCAKFEQRRTFDDLLAQVRDRVLKVLSHSDYPFPLMVEKLGIGSDFAVPPVFQALFVLHQASSKHSADFARLAAMERGARIRLGELELEAIDLEEQAAQFDVTLMMGEGEEGLRGAWQYNSDLFEASTVERWAESFRVMLEGIVAGPESLVGQLPLLSERERKRLLWENNQTEMAYEPQQCLHQRIEKQAERKPRATAVVWGGEELNYEELDGRANQVARYLQELGVGEEELVGICMNRTPSMVIALLGVWKAGGAYIALDPQYPEQRLRWMLEDAGVRLVLSEESLRERVEGSGVQVVSMEESGKAIAEQSREKVEKRSSSRHLAYVIYTSGSSGKPKGVMLTHQNGGSFVSWAEKAFSVEEMSGVLGATSICFDLSIFELWATLSRGGTVVLAEDVLRWWEQEWEKKGGEGSGRVKLINTVPSVMARLLERGKLPESVRTVNLAGEALGGKLVQEIYEAGKVERVNNLYGPTETTTYSTWTRVRNGETVTIGGGVGNTELYVLDGELELVPVGVVGELYIGGAGVARGYWKRPEVTAERFMPNCHRGKGERMYRSGDLVRWREGGKLEYVGRADQQVKVRGYRIELGEIESVLGQLEGVKESAVVVRELGGEKRLVAYVGHKQGEAVTPEQARKHLQEKLPGYMVPGQVVVLERLPKTPNGKLDRKLLPEPEPVVVRGRSAGNEVERAVAEIWSEVLGVEEVGAEENFFDLGGHSLLATQILARVEARFLIPIPLAGLFESPTVAAMAQAVESGAAKKSTSRKIRRVARGSSNQRQITFETPNSGSEESHNSIDVTRS